MKKLTLAIIIAVLLCFSITSCESNSDDGTYEVGDVLTFGKYEWVVLEVDVEENRVLLLAENIVTKRAYHASKTSITWAECEMREYLNSTFIEESFTVTERKMIVESIIDNASNQIFGTAGGVETTDKVFLLSLDEVIEYFGDSGELYGRPEKKPREVWTFEDYYIDDEYNSDRIAEDADGTPSSWWLRSPGYFDFSAAIISYDGILWVEGFGLTVNQSVGVRPALWIEID